MLIFLYNNQVERAEVPDTGIVKLPKPTPVDELRIVFEEPEGNVPEYNIKVQIHACFKYEGISFMDHFHICT